MARRSFGLRQLLPVGIFGAGTAASVITKAIPEYPLAATLNCRLYSYSVRALSAKLQLNESYVSRVPVPEIMPNTLPALESACVALKRWLVARDLSERTFLGLPPKGAVSLAGVHCAAIDEAQAVATVFHPLEGDSERVVFEAYGIAEEDLAAVLNETGTPAAWYPLIEEYDALPVLCDGLDVPDELRVHLAGHDREALALEDLERLKARLRALYEAGPGAKAEEAEGDSNPGDEEETEETVGLGAHISVPAESFLEELSQKLEIHPISVYRLLKELCEQGGVVSLPELCRHVGVYFTVMILRLLGHRWPTQIEAGEPVPEWADSDGIISGAGHGQRTGILIKTAGRTAGPRGARPLGT